MWDTDSTEKDASGATNEQDDNTHKGNNNKSTAQSGSNKKDWRFWAIFPALCLASLLTALDATVMSTALPTISQQLGSSASYIWAVNAYTLSVTAVLPLCGQLANICGRKWTFVVSLAIFAAGSGICGGAHNTTMLIGGRTVQGLGGAGLNVLPAMVVCDLVPLRERQLYQSVIYAAFAVGTFVGPIIGGALANQWRWVFYMNIPVTVCAIVLTVLFLKVHHGADREEKVVVRLRRIDYLGNAIFIASMTAILIALSDARQPSDWKSWSILVPLCLGLFGLVLFVLWERLSFCQEPTMPIRLFMNRTSAVAFSLTFLHGVVLYWTSYFLPVYFQSVRLATPLQSGIDTLPSVAPLVPFGILGGMMIAKTGRFRENHVIGFSLITIGAGCFSTMGENTATSIWAVLEVIFAAGAGFILTATLTAIQAPLPESDVAAATATWAFVQSLGFICGAAIPSNIFNTRFEQFLPDISDPRVRTALSDGAAYEKATKVYLMTLSPYTRNQVIGIFVKALKLVWEVEVAFAGLGVLLSLFLKNVVLRTHLDTEYGYKEKEARDESNEA